MNSNIKKLLDQLEDSRLDIAKTKVKLQLEYNKLFDKSKELAKAVSFTEQASEYRFDQYGEIQSVYHFSELDLYSECREYLEAWLSDYCIIVDWNSDCLLFNQGESLIIQDDTRRDNGVWLSGKCVVNETEYKVDGEVDEDKRNELIEAHMEKTGYFPGVFRADQHGNVFPVSTLKTKEAS